MTTVYKDIRNNWSAEDNITLDDKRVLRVTTIKVSDGSIVTRATVSIREGQFMSHRMFTDFSACLKTSRNRCTEKNVVAQHEEAMTKRPELLEAVDAWYSKMPA